MYSTSTKMAGRLSSPTSTMSLVHHHQLHDEPFDDMPVFTSPTKGAISNNSTHGGDNNSVTAVSVTASVTSSSTFLEEDSSERSLRAQIESLRQQLAERDATVNELQRQMQADKRQYDKLQQRWDLFFGGTSSGGNNTTASTTSSRTSYRASSHLTSNHQETTTMTATELQRLNDHMDQLETEKEAAQQKTLKLSLALADCKARVNTLEMELEESHGIIQAQNTSTGILLGFGRRQQSSSPTPTASKKKSGRRSVSNSPATPVKSPAITAVTPPPFMGISDIELDEEESEHRPQDQSTDEFLHNDATPAIQEEDALHSASFETPADESFLGNWSQRPLSFLSERPTDTSQQPLTSSSQRPIPSGSLRGSSNHSMRGSSTHGGRSSWGRFWSSSSNVTQPQQ